MVRTAQKNPEKPKTLKLSPGNPDGILRVKIYYSCLHLYANVF